MSLKSGRHFFFVLSFIFISTTLSAKESAYVVECQEYNSPDGVPGWSIEFFFKSKKK